jgi:hypothetical protein
MKTGALCTSCPIRAKQDNTSPEAHVTVAVLIRQHAEGGEPMVETNVFNVLNLPIPDFVSVHKRSRGNTS